MTSMSGFQLVSYALLIAGALFYFAGTVGLLRFPDVYARLHALTKVDNLGLGLIVLGLVITSDSVAIALKLVLIWVLVLGAGATSAYLIANSARRQFAEDGKIDSTRTPQ